jgi:hypothetical protein
LDKIYRTRSTTSVLAKAGGTVEERRDSFSAA